MCDGSVVAGWQGLGGLLPLASLKAPDGGVRFCRALFKGTLQVRADSL
jgi:hypothetical protein